MKYFDNLFSRNELSAWHAHYQRIIPERTSIKQYGDLPKWLDILNRLPTIHKPLIRKLHTETICIGKKDDFPLHQRQQVEQQLLALAPWRKGPYNIAGIQIDSEWRSDWKWQRVKPYIASLEGKRILDVGCGNAYHCWRMLDQNPQYIQAIDPSPRFWIQHLAINHFAQEHRLDFIPIAMEEMPKNMKFFDTAFSMGVLYHRRHPSTHLQELHAILKPNGELVLETLIVDENTKELIDGVLTPKDRYAQMRNVWSLLTIKKLETLLKDNGFFNIRCVDMNQTSLQEQRQTPWMQFHSLQQFLDPEDKSKTIEGYPAPKRAIIIAQSKSI